MLLNSGYNNKLFISKVKLMQLSKEMIESFHENGFLILRNFDDKASCEAILDVALAHLKHKIEPIESEIDYGAKSQEYRTEVTDYNSMEENELLTVRRLRQVYDRDRIHTRRCLTNGNLGIGTNAVFYISHTSLNQLIG